MRVIHIITRMIVGGAQENTLYTCQGLAEKYGDEVLLVTGPSEGPEGCLFEQSRAGGVDVRAVNSLRRSIQPRDLLAYRQLIHIIRDFKPDVVHTHSAKGGFLGRAAAWKCRVPAVIHTVHGAPFHPYQNWVSRQFFIQLEKWAAGRCHAMISVADQMTRLLVEAGVAPPEKFTTIHSGMEVQPFIDCDQHRRQSRAEFGFHEDHVVVGKIARFYRLKGHEFLIRAARNVLDRNPRVRFLLVGDGFLMPNIQQAVRQAGMSDHFRFTGLVSPERIPYYLSAMDMLVHTSLREGLARTLPQALLAARPVISFDVDGACEVVIDRVTGRLLPPRSVPDLAEAIVWLAGNSEARRRLGQGGQKRFSGQFDHHVMVGKIRDLYRQVLRISPEISS